MVINSNDFYKIEGKYKILSTNTNADNNLEIRVIPKKTVGRCGGGSTNGGGSYLTWINA